MAPDLINPPVSRRELGAILRTLRTSARLTVDEVADQLLCSAAKVSRLETGQRGASELDIRDLCTLYGVTDPAMAERLVSLARESRGRAWWDQYNLPYGTFIGLEQAAVSIRDFGADIFPGLLQIPEYVQAIHDAAIPRLSPGRVREQIEARKERQKILTRTSPPVVHVIVDEAAVHRAIGGASCMAAQLKWVMECCASLTNFTFQVLPYSAGAHPALHSPFIILEEAPPVASVAYTEGLTGFAYLERPEELETCRQAFDYLERIALGAAESARLLAAEHDRYRS